MLELVTTTQFRKDLKRLRKRGADMKKLDDVLQTLVGDYIGFRECNVAPDWLLVYAIDKGQLILTASRTGSHSDLF